MIDAELKASFAKDICLLRYVGIHVVVVHGGGPQINATSGRWASRRSSCPACASPTTRRWTSSRWSSAAASTRRSWVSSARQGGRAVGLSGKDDGFIRARKLASVRAQGRRRGRIDRRPGPRRRDRRDRARGRRPARESRGSSPSSRRSASTARAARSTSTRTRPPEKSPRPCAAEKLILLTDVEAVRSGDGRADSLAHGPRSGAAHRKRRHSLGHDPQGAVRARRARRGRQEGPHARRPPQARCACSRSSPIKASAPRSTAERTALALKERKPPGRQDRQVRNLRDFDGSNPGVFGVLTLYRRSNQGGGSVFLLFLGS